MRGNVTGLEGNSGSGSISLNVSGGTAPYNYSWTSGEQTNVINEKARGDYTVIVTDAIGRTQSRTYHIGYKIHWINQVGVSESGGILTKNVSNESWTSGAVSSNLLPANTDGWIAFTAINGADYRIGFAVNDVINYSYFTHSFFVDNTSGSAFEGATPNSFGNIQTGDILKISREGSSIKYYRNEVVIKTVSVNPSQAIKVKTCLQIPGSSTPNINSSFWNSDGIVRTYYAIASGIWTTPSIWSLSENGPPSTVYPDDVDKVVIKGHEVTVNSSVKASGITITSTNDDTKLKVDGNMGLLTVKGNIVMNRGNNSNTAEVLLVQNNGRLDVK